MSKKCDATALNLTPTDYVCLWAVGDRCIDCSFHASRLATLHLTTAPDRSKSLGTVCQDCSIQNSEVEYSTARACSLERISLRRGMVRPALEQHSFRLRRRLAVRAPQLARRPERMQLVRVEPTSTRIPPRRRPAMVRSACP